MASMLDGAVEAARRLADAVPGDRDGLRRAAAAGAAGAGPSGRGCARSSAPWTPSARPSRPSSPRTTGSSSPASTSAPGAMSSGSRAGWPGNSPDGCADTPISETAIMGLGVGCGHGRHAARGRADVPRLHRRLLRPVAQPGGQAALHDRGRGGDGADGAHPVRCRSIVGQPALAEPGGAAGAHSRVDRRDAVDAGRHLRPAARLYPGPQSGGVHREPSVVRHEGCATAARLHTPDRAVCCGAPRPRHHGRLGLTDGARGAGRCGGARGGGHLRRGDRPQNGGPPRHGADPGLGAQDEPAAHRPRGGRAVRHRRRDRGDGGPGGFLGSRCADRAHRRRAVALALFARPRTSLAARTARTSPPPSAGSPPCSCRLSSPTGGR